MGAREMKRLRGAIIMVYSGASRKRRFTLTLAHTHGILSWLT